MSQRPKFSIVIPTRNRSEYLAASLQTCIEIDHPDFEIVVSDNHSSDATPDMVAQLADPRIRYTRTSEDLSMTRNFENALRHARGEFLIFIGDDDGVLSFGLRALEEIFSRHPEIDAVDWALNPFLWPHAKQAKRPLRWLGNLRDPEIETADEAWRRINHPRSFEFNELLGFSIYHGCARRSVFEAAAADGVSLFAGPIPDVAFSIRVLRYARRKMRLGVALSINGSCRMSNGVAGFVSNPTEAQKEIVADFTARNAADFPNAALSGFLWTRENAYLGPLLDEHIERYGDLRKLDAERWRRIYLEGLALVSPTKAKKLIDQLNAALAWTRERGAEGMMPITFEDLQVQAKDRLPRLFSPPFRFSEKTLALARERSPRTPVSERSGGRLVSLSQGANHIEMELCAPGNEFTIYDYVKVTESLMPGDPYDPAILLVDDPAVFNAEVVLGVLERVALAETAAIPTEDVREDRTRRRTRWSQVGLALLGQVRGARGARLPPATPIG